MELNAEINKVFGQEMAKLFAAQISEEELNKKAKEAWWKLNENGNGYWNKETEVDKMVKTAIGNRLKDEVAKIIETEEFKKDIETKAIQIVNEIKEATHIKLVDEVSSRLTMLSTGYGGFDLRSYVEYVVNDCIHR